MEFCQFFRCMENLFLPPSIRDKQLKKLAMKIRVICILFMAFCAISFSVSAGEKNSFIDDYKISVVEDFEPNKLFHQSWEITYGESNRPVQVFLKETKKGKQYIVRTKYFEVKYLNTKDGFGVHPLKYSEATVPEELNSKVINQAQMNSQKVISKSKVDQKEALELIAGFLPELVNDSYKNILN